MERGKGREKGNSIGKSIGKERKNDSLKWRGEDTTNRAYQIAPLWAVVRRIEVRRESKVGNDLYISLTFTQIKYFGEEN